MATRKTTTKSKTKRAATSKKATTKTTAKKDTKAAVTGRQAKAKQTSKILTLRRWNIILAVVLFLQAVALFVIGKAYTVPVVSQYLTPDSLATQAAGHQVLAPAVRHMFSIDVRYIILAFLLVPAAIYLIIATVRRKEYEAGLNAKVDRYRWLSYGIASALMLTLIAMLNGVQDSALILAIIVLVGLLNFLGYFGEAKVQEMKSKIQTFVTLCVAGAAVWLIVAAYLKGAIFYGNGLSSYVYCIDGIIFVLTLLLAVVKLQTLRAKGRWADYLMGEQAFMLISFLAITALTWLTFAGFLV